MNDDDPKTVPMPLGDLDEIRTHLHSNRAAMKSMSERIDKVGNGQIVLREQVLEISGSVAAIDKRLEKNSSDSKDAADASKLIMDVVNAGRLSRTVLTWIAAVAGSLTGIITLIVSGRELIKLFQ